MPRLLDGTPLPLSEALRLGCNADILPALFDTEGQELWLGRKYRSATEAQRAALIVRDKHCIGCGRSATWCEVHHITEWFRGGLTDIDNLVLVCTGCHHSIHDDGWVVHRNKERHLRVATATRASRRSPTLEIQIQIASPRV